MKLEFCATARVQRNNKSNALQFFLKKHSLLDPFYSVFDGEHKHIFVILISFCTSQKLRICCWLRVADVDGNKVFGRFVDGRNHYTHAGW